MVERRKINELLAKYELEPDLDDVYVEGITDKNLIDKAHKHLGLHRPVFAIDDIEVPDATVLSQGLTSGNKQRVISLSRALSLPIGSKAVFLVDKDLDLLLGINHAIGNIVYSKYSDIENAFFTDAIIRDLTIDVAKANIINFDEFMDFTRDYVSIMSAVRLMAIERQHYYKIISPVKNINWKAEKPTIDYKVCIAANFNSGNINAVSAESIGNFNKWKDKVDEFDFRQHCHGHTYLELIECAIRAKNGNGSVSAALSNLLILLVPRVADCILAPIIEGA
jgi:hypothetical protein